MPETGDADQRGDDAVIQMVLGVAFLVDRLGRIGGIAHIGQQTCRYDDAPGDALVVSHRVLGRNAGTGKIPSNGLF